MGPKWQWADFGVFQMLPKCYKGQFSQIAIQNGAEMAVGPIWLGADMSRADLTRGRSV